MRTLPFITLLALTACSGIVPSGSHEGIKTQSVPMQGLFSGEKGHFEIDLSRIGQSSDQIPQ